MEHEAYFYRTLWAVIIEGKDGGQTMNFFNDEDEARAEAEMLADISRENNIEGQRVLLSPLEYSPKKNRIMSENIITEETEVIYGEVSE